MEEALPVPTTLTGLLLFIVLLLPGLAYATIRDRRSAERRLSAFKETGSVVFASVISELFILGIFAITRASWPENTPDVGRLIREGADYAQDHYASLSLWAIGLLVLATLLASFVAWRAPSVPHESIMSAWWLIFERFHRDSDLYVGCVLEDGSFIQGRLASYNKSSDDSPDREIVLVGPLQYRPAGSTDSVEYPAGAVCLSARKMLAMFVSYLDPDLAEVEGEEEERQATSAA
ncbi:DUF6338 family protein [Streptomyces torulosus]|uniref:DUF6338 family protein n=1 Tax=Streptomyces torulosus TaxID=68276 RepID=UPI000B189F4B|nr:DUF6338 family protein [Streptomyces torulosus]